MKYTHARAALLESNATSIQDFTYRRNLDAATGRTVHFRLLDIQRRRPRQIPHFHIPKGLQLGFGMTTRYEQRIPEVFKQQYETTCFTEHLLNRAVAW